MCEQEYGPASSAAAAGAPAPRRGFEYQCGSRAVLAVPLIGTEANSDPWDYDARVGVKT